jgi:glutamate synthase domain-containing protein 3
VVNTLSRHNLGIGLPAGADITFEGSVGYYCGGLNTGARVHVERNAGWALGEGMDGGHISVDGYAGMSVGAAMISGTIHVKGNTGPRCGVAMKGGNIVVEGKIGYQSGFMAHSGKIIALGGGGESCADALWEGEVWVAGDVDSFGVDVKVVEPTAEEVAEVDVILDPLGLVDSSRNWRKLVSGQRLWYFESRDASAWLMI